MSRLLCFTSCILQIIIYSNAIGLYSIVGPGTIRSKFKYNVAVSVHQADGPCQIKVGISGPSYNEIKSVDVQPMSTANVEFDVPQLRSGEYYLTAVGLWYLFGRNHFSGLVFENYTVLNFANYEPSIFIQTDKATYKAGDLVQFRVLFLDENTRPARVEQPIQILIKDGANNSISQLKDIELNTGVYTGKIQLSEQPVLGNWIIEVINGERNSEIKYFGVAKYVLPKFDVAIETDKNVAIPDNIIQVNVRSTYTYGKAVKGKASVSLALTEPRYGWPNLISVKTISIEEKGLVEFDLRKDSSNANWNILIKPKLKVVVVMEEELTGIKRNTSIIINLHKNRYTIIGITTPTTYQKNKLLKYKIAVTNMDGSPVQDMKNPVTLILERNRYLYEKVSTLEYVSKLDENGGATIELMISEDTNHYYSVQCKYQDITEHFPSLSKLESNAEEEFLELVVVTKNPSLGRDISIEITCSEVLHYYVYTIVARGNILKSEHITVPGGRKTHMIKFTPTFEMIPHTKIYVHFIYNSDLRFQEKTISFEKHFENSLYINTTAQARPAEDVKLMISSDPGSFVGLIGVDQSVISFKSGNDISTDDIFNSLISFDANIPLMGGTGRYPGQVSGLVTMTNANYPWEPHFEYVQETCAEGTGGGGAAGCGGGGGAFGGSGGSVGLKFVRVQAQPKPQQPKVPKVPLKLRMEFPETWFFENLHNINANGITLTKKVPDTVTSWVITGFSVNPKTGFALTESPTKIQVFQPFFISTNLPYSVKKGEVIAIPVSIFNYMDKDLDAEITMDNTDREFEFTEAINKDIDSPLDEIKRVKKVTIPSNAGKSVSFMIRPSKVGQVTLKISAVSPLAGDAIQQSLKVEAEGVIQYENRAIFVNLKDTPEHSEQLTVDIPPEAVTDSEYIELSVGGDLLGPTIKHLEKLILKPHGSGEQNMVNFVPNVLVLKYLETTNRNISTITEKVKHFLEIGYQRQLSYRHNDGSYSAFGKSDKIGSTWLTAYVMRSFHQAAKYSYIEVKILKAGLDFLVSRQADNGNFVEHGKLVDFEHQNELGLNAFVLLAFLENVVHFPMYQVNIDKGMQYLLENIDKSNDQYSLAIAASALRLANNPIADKVIAKLQSVAKQDKDRKWWSKAPLTNSDHINSNFHAQSNDIEITAYVLLAMLEREPLESALPIVKWLVSQRNSNGGFASTQDTVVGLQALIKFAEKIGTGIEDMNINFVSTGGTEDKGSFRVNTDNSLILQTHVLPRTTRKVDFTAQGKGSAVVQLAYRYNLAENYQTPSFQVETEVKDNTPTQELSLEVCAKFMPIDETNTKNESNMAVLEVSLPSGYTAESEHFGDIKSVEQVKQVETENADSKVIIYFDSMTVGVAKCVPVRASKAHAVAKLKPAAVQVYDYYKPKRRATQFYQVGSSLCSICDGADCGAGCRT